MTTPQKQLPKIRTFFRRKTEPPHNNGVDMSAMLRVVTMMVSFGALTLSMLGAAKLVIDVFNDGLAGNLQGLLVKVVVLGFTFFFGWGAGLTSIRAFGNMFYPLVVRIYAWLVIMAVAVLYIKVIQKLYMQEYDMLHYWAYLVMLLGGLFVLLCLHLLLEDHDLRPFAIPLLIIGVLQLIVIVYKYVFEKSPNGLYIFGDLTIFVVMTSISTLMLMHIGILSPLRSQVSGLFIMTQNSDQDGNGME